MRLKGAAGPGGTDPPPAMDAAAWVAFLRAAFVIALPVGLFWVLVSGANRSVQDVVLRTSVIYDWVVGTPTLAAVIGRNREARRSS